MRLASRLICGALALGLSLLSPVSPQDRRSSAVIASPSPAESDIRSVAQRYFTLYGGKELDGIMSLWSRNSPDYESTRQTLEKQFAARDITVASLTIGPVESEGERATLRVAAEMTVTDRQSRQASQERRLLALELVREDGEWKLLSVVPAVNHLAAALARAASEQSQERLLAPEKELMTAALPAALRELATPLIRNGDYAAATRISELSARIAGRIGDRSGLGAAWVDLGMIHSRQNHDEQAEGFYQKGLLIFSESGDEKGMARALYDIGQTDSGRGRYSKALDSLNRSLAISEKSGVKSMIATTLNGIGIVHRYQGEYDLALECYRRSQALCEELNDKAALKKVLNSIGNIHQLQGSYDLALQYYQQSRALCEELGDRVALEVALNNIGNIYDLQGRYAEALSYFQKGLRIYEDLGSAADKRNLSFHLANIGYVYRHQGRYDLALDYERRSLKIREELNDKLGIAVMLGNIGSLFKAQGLDAQALDWSQRALKLQEEMGEKQGMAWSLNDIAEIYHRQGHDGLALPYLQKSLQIREEIGDQPGLASGLESLSRLRGDKGDYAGMLELSRRAAGLAEKINSPAALWTAQEESGRALQALGRPAEARRSFLDAIGTIESMRRSVAGGGQQEQSFLEDKLAPWFGMIELLVSQKEYAEALTFAERSKARVLLDVLQAGRPNLRTSLSATEKQAEEGKRLQLVSLNTQLTRELRRDQPDPARIADLKASIEKARLEFEHLETSLYVSHPELKIVRGEAAIISADELASLLPDAAGALLEYVVTDKVTYLFVLTRAKASPCAEIRVFPLPIPRAELASRTESFRQQLAGRDLGFRASAHSLYHLLLGPAEPLLRAKTSLVIVPDDRLWELPFQALLTDGGRYLLEDSAIAYAPSLTVLREMRAHRRTSGSTPATLLAFGNPTVGSPTIQRATLAAYGENFDPLPEAENEVRALGQIIGPGRSRVYVGPEASEARFKAEAGNAGIIHFATHGTLNDAEPMYSHLVLAQGDKNEDGLLEAWELMQLDLKADLAVLSACDTARGKFGAGEGVIGLTWALFVAGVPATVVSQWQVESAGTRDLMLHFYRALKGRPAAYAPQTKAEALRQAALKLMSSGGTSHPFYWAGFVLIGDGR